jgi:phage FluMu protein gp41
MGWVIFRRPLSKIRWAFSLLRERKTSVGDVKGPLPRTCQLTCSDFFRKQNMQSVSFEILNEGKGRVIKREY